MHIWWSLHVYKSFTKIFGRKNKSEYISDFSLNLLVVSVWLNMSDTIGYLHHSLWTWRNLWLDMFGLGRICPTLVGTFRKNDLILMIAGDSNFSWPWDWLHWKSYLLSFPCIWRTSKSVVVCILCVNLKVRWSWTSRVTQSQTLQSRFGLDLHVGVHISLALQHSLDVPHVLHDPLLHLAGSHGLTGAKEERDVQGLRRV
jgi:hypothetical protein